MAVSTANAPTAVRRGPGVDYPGVALVYFCHDGEGKFLMALRSEQSRDEQGRWDIGGGALDFGDTVEATLAREIGEEYCTDVLDATFLGYRDVHRTHAGTPTHWVALDFAVRVDPAKARIGEPHKFDGLGWFTLDTIPERTHSQFPTFLDLYRDRLSEL